MTRLELADGVEVDLQATSHEFQTDVVVEDAGEDLSDHEALEVLFAWKTA